MDEKFYVIKGEFSNLMQLLLMMPGYGWGMEIGGRGEGRKWSRPSVQREKGVGFYDSFAASKNL